MIKHESSTTPSYHSKKSSTVTTHRDAGTDSLIPGHDPLYVKQGSLIETTKYNLLYSYPP